jgi:hypothetical protein
MIRIWLLILPDSLMTVLSNNKNIDLGAIREPDRQENLKKIFSNFKKKDMF